MEVVILYTCESILVELELDVEETLPKVLGNWDLLLQVLDNLVGNALKFNRSGGLLMLRAYTWPDSCTAGPPTEKDSAPYCELVSPLPRLRVEISDTGCGITEADQSKIFDRFLNCQSITGCHVTYNPINIK